MARPLPKPHGRPQGAGGARGASRPDSPSVTTTDALCGKSPAQSEQWYCWIDRRRIISASAENRGNSCQRKRKGEERRERYIAGVTALYDRGRDIAPVAMTGPLEPGTRAKNTSELADSLLGGAAATWPGRAQEPP